MKNFFEKLRVEDWVVVWVSIPLLLLASLIPADLPSVPATLVGEVAWYNIGLLFAMLMGFIGSAEQILGSDGYRLGALFPAAFAAVAITGGVSAFINGRLVRTWGMHRLSHGSHLIHVGLTAAFFAVAYLWNGLPPLWLFMALMVAMQFFFSFAISNYNALALDPLGEVAGTASSLIGAFTTLIGTVGGALIGQSFDGTVAPLSAGFLAASGVTLLIVVWTERGRLFQPHHQGVVPAIAE